MELVIDALSGPPAGSQAVEVAERKGLGHPDTICDALAERISVALCRHYRERFGLILHHNVDKILLCAGAARPAFGGGQVIEPVELVLAGRATTEHRGERIPVAEIAVSESRAWLRANLRELDAQRHVRITPRFRPVSADLAHLYARGEATTPLANDTSCGAGFAPLTPLEQAVLAVERALNAAQTKAAHPAIGEDIKVLGVRQNSRIHLTIGCAMIGRYLQGREDYLAAKAAALQIALEAARRSAQLEVDAVVNAADRMDSGEFFLTVTGTSAEAGDDGEVGRGNRVCGLITPYRPMTLEAAAGKNPVNHVGKLYNLAAADIAAAVVQLAPGVRDAACVLTSQIGCPIDDPQVVNVRVALESGVEVAAVSAPIRQIVAAQLQRFGELQSALLSGQRTVY